MPKFNIEWATLRLNLIVFFTILVILIAMIFSTNYIFEETVTELKNQQQALTKLKRIYRTTVNDQALYSQYVTRFKKMEQLGIINEEKRLSWIEILQKQNDLLKLPTLGHKLQPQAIVSIERKRRAPRTQSNLTIKKTNMILTAGLFHEIDLVSIMAGLKKANGLFNLRSCTIIKQNNKILSVRGANFSAECLIEWYAIYVKEKS